MVEKSEKSENFEIWINKNIFSGGRSLFENAFRPKSPQKFDQIWHIFRQKKHEKSEKKWKKVKKSEKKCLRRQHFSA